MAKQTDDKANQKPAIEPSAQDAAAPADEAATPVDSNFAAQLAATEAAAALAVETLEPADTLENAETDGDLAAEAALATPALQTPALPTAPASAVVASAPSQTPPDADGLVTNPDLATVTNDAGQSGKPVAPDASLVQTSTEAGQTAPGPLAAADGALSKVPLAVEAKTVPTVAATEDASASAARQTEPVAGGQDSLVPARLAEAEQSAAEKTPAQQLEAKSAALETVSRLEQALQPLPPQQRSPEPIHANLDKTPPLPELARALPPAAVPVEIGLRALQGLKEFQIRLDPAELGRVDVRLEIGEDKSVSAKVVVDRVETLHLLQRDAKTLERAFEQAGLKSTEAGIDISLRDPAQQQRNGGGGAWTGDGEFANRRARTEEQPEIQPIPVRRTLHVGALDLSI